MKKHLVRLTTIVLAIGFSAFTSISKPVKKNGKFTNYTLYIQTNPTSAGIVTDLTKWASRTGQITCGLTTADEMACQITTVSDVYLHDTTISSVTYQTPNRLGSTPTGESEFGTITEATSNGGVTYYVRCCSHGTYANKNLPE